uniref:Uncharacterized protein n=1 Tax=Oryza rufipogon TaxID=4529 RepID=A0A0E0PT39_ORYRU
MAAAEAELLVCFCECECECECSLQFGGNRSAVTAGAGARMEKNKYIGGGYLLSEEEALGGGQLIDEAKEMARKKDLELEAEELIADNVDDEIHLEEVNDSTLNESSFPCTAMTISWRTDRRNLITGTERFMLRNVSHSSQRREKERDKMIQSEGFIEAECFVSASTSRMLLVEVFSGELVHMDGELAVALNNVNYFIIGSGFRGSVLGCGPVSKSYYCCILLFLHFASLNFTSLPIEIVDEGFGLLIRSRRGMMCQGAGTSRMLLVTLEVFNGVTGSGTHGCCLLGCGQI